jgi:hypothetical protein
MPERISKTSHDKRSRRSAGTVAISGAFTPTVDPSIVACRQVEAPEWHASLDHGQRQHSLRALPSSGEVFVTESEVDPNGSRSGGATKESTIHSAAPVGGGDDVAQTSTANTEGHAAIQSSSTDPTGKISPSEGDTTRNASGSVAAAGSGTEVGATIVGTEVGAETGGTKGLVTGATEVGAETGGMKATKAAVKDGMGEEKVPSSGKVLMTLKTVAVETIILSDGSSSDISDEGKDCAPTPPVQESSFYAPKSDVGSDVVVGDVLQQIVVGGDQSRPLSPSSAINAQVPLMQSSDPIVKVENDWLRDKEEWRKRKKGLEQEHIMADTERSRQQAAAMQEFVQSQFEVNLNDLFSSSKWSSTSNTSGFWTTKPTLFSIPPMSFAVANAIMQQYSPSFDALTHTSGVVRSAGVTSLLTSSPDRLAPYGPSITDMEYLRLEDNLIGKKASLHKKGPPPHCASSDIVPIHYSQAVSYYVSTHEAEIAPPLKYPRVEDTPSAEPSSVRTDEEMESPWRTTVTPERMQSNDCDDPFGGISPLEKSVQRGCKDGQLYNPALEYEDDELGNETGFAIHRRLEASGTAFALRKMLGSGNKTDSVDRLLGDVRTSDAEMKCFDSYAEKDEPKEGSDDDLQGGRYGDAADEVDYENDKCSSSHRGSEGMGMDIEREDEEDFSQAEECNGHSNLVRFSR